MNKKLLLLFFSLLVITLPLLGLAASPSTAASTWFKDIICRFLNMVLWPVFLGLVIIMFIWAGILFLTAKGDPGKLDMARKAVIWAVVGIAVAIIGFSIISLVGKLVGATGIGSLNCSAGSTTPPPPPGNPPQQCNNDGDCDAGEDANNCAADCPGNPPPQQCNNDGDCDAGEDANNCAADCGGNPPPPNTGACCTISGSCTDVAQNSCVNPSVYMGNGSSCATILCFVIPL